MSITSNFLNILKIKYNKCNIWAREIANQSYFR